MNKYELRDAPDGTKGHQFFRCEFSCAFWFKTSLQINMESMGANDFVDGWQRLVERLDKELDVELVFQLMAFGLWRIWKCRNEAIFNANPILPHVALDLWQQQVREF